MSALPSDAAAPAELPEAVAIVGWAGRYPGAAHLDQLWDNLRGGVESVRFFTRDELLAAGLDPQLIDRPDYVPAKGRLDDVELFDASFFGYTPREAAVMDPQHRLFLECAWEALENAGRIVPRDGQAVGVYAASSINTYLLRNWNTEAFRALDGLELLISSDKDFLATRVAYKLDLKGPAVVVQTACSSSLSAVCQAAQSLLDFQCDLALAGGVSVNNPRVGGYVYRQGAIMSPDGHCRAFDAEAQGTLSGEGVGIVVLKRLSEALADGDTIHAVLRGFALNNDGANKIGYTAPSVDGQAEVIRMAQAFAGVGPDDISYIEAHGTGTELGDPIEIAALTQAFRAGTARRGFCGIGSVKTNFGHTDAAAGVTGLLKAALALDHGEIPPSLHYQRPNPHIDFANSPFRVIDRLTPWPAEAPRPWRAGVSAFGIGGTNAHVIVEEAPPQAASGPSRPAQLLLLSARSEKALDAAQQRLAAHLAAHPEQPLADVCHTLQAGRRAFDWRRAVVVRDAAAARDRLAQGGGVKRVAGDRPVVFCFSGQGTQHPGMGAGLYRDEPVFRQTLDHCLALLREHAGLDLAPLLFAAADDEAAAAALRDTRCAQPALFALEYALASTWMHWGVQPDAMIGHSIGEYVAACLAGVMSLDDALALVALRGRLVASLPAGAMLAVPMAEKPLAPLLRPPLAIAAVNAPKLCVVAGETAAVAALEDELRASGLAPTRLHTSHAFHSPMLDPILDEFHRAVARVRLSPPQRPYVTNVDGGWIRPEQATDPRHWVRHLREAVRFSAGVRLLLEDEARLFIEIGPGATLTGLVRQHVEASGAERALASMRSPRDGTDDGEFLLGALGRAWQSGVNVDWDAFAAQERRRRVPLPSYPFERRRFWVEPSATDGPPRAEAPLRKLADPADWLHVPAWRQAPLAPADAPAGPWLVLADAAGLGDALVAALAATGRRVTVATAGTAFEQPAPGRFTLRPAVAEDHEALFAALEAQGAAPAVVVHAWAADGGETRCFWSPLATVRAAGRRGAVRLLFVTAGAQAVLAGEHVDATAALVAGPALVGRAEYERLDARWIDLPREPAAAAAALLAEAGAPAAPRGAPAEPVAWRGAQRWLRGHAPLPLAAPAPGVPGLGAGAVVLVTGGFGGIGLALAAGIARSVPQARLALLGRHALPPRETWDGWLAAQPAGDATARRIRAVQALEQAGATVLPLAVDLADAAALAQAVAMVRQRLGRIDAAIHAAGVAGGGIVELKTPEAAAAVLAPKVSGTRALEAALAATPGAPPLAWLLHCSSLTATLGSAGQVDYTAANAFQDAHAHEAAAQGRRVVSVQWDTWAESGMALAAELPAAMAAQRAQGLAAGLTDAEGFEVLRRALAAGQPQLLVSTRDLAARLRPPPAAARPLAPRADAEAPPDGDAAAADDAAPEGRARRSLSTPFVAPRTDTERAVAAAWQDLFGIEAMGVDDDFFEADGHSLLAIQIVARLTKDLNVRLPVNALFESPTIARLAARIDGLRAEPGSDEARIAEALAMVEQLSDDEIAKLLADDGAAPH
ncbi:SDR family NAD(P)-dependent oxidoreductase [Ideonella sp. DXS22W]|uniref:SDR family NAD(P)-dependent oxidoreductase n=1 Tax=Pseudaquabacterium inlustre TaxID=2984192 RepID=A0ABU9CGZ9_9BURK